MADARFNTRRLTGIAGLGAGILFGGGSALWGFEQPRAGASTAKLLAFYRDNDTEIVIGASLALGSIAFFVFFASGVRALLREVEGDDLLGTAAFGGALLLTAAGLAAEVINMVGALRADAGQLTPDLARSVFEISYVLGYNAAGVGIGTFLLALAAAALRARALMPRWTAVALVVVGLAFLTPLSRYLLGPAVLLLLAVSVQLLRRPRT